MVSLMRNIVRDSMRFRLVVAGVLLAALSATAMATTIGPAFGYTATDVTTFSFLDVSSGGASVLTNTDDGTAALALPFPFEFYGTTYPMLCVSSNGAAYFVSTLAQCGTIDDDINADLSSAAPPGDRPGVFPFWSDLNFNLPGAGGVNYQAQGTVGSRKFIIQWANGYPQSAAAGISPNPVTFQVVLFEGSNQILFQYQTVGLGAGNPASNGGQAAIGIRDVGGHSNGRRIAWSSNSSVVADSTAILFTGGKLTPFISVTGGAFPYTGSPHSGSGVAYGTGGLADPLSPALTFSYQGNAPTFYGPTATAPTDRGTYTVTGSFAGNVGYTSGSGTGSLAITEGTQTVAFSSSPSAPVVSGPTYAPTATSGASGNPVVFSSASLSVCTVATSTVTFIGVGTCTLHADQAGNTNYAAAPQATQSFAVGQGTQAVAFTSSPSSPVVGGPTYALTATSGASGNPVVFSSASLSACTVATSTVTFVGVGTCTLHADQAGTTNYAAAPQATQSFAVGQGTQTITFTSTAPTSPTVGGPTYTVTATGGASGNAVTFSSLTTSVCTLSGSTVSFVGAGGCQVAANQAGSDNYFPASQVTQNMTVASAPALVPTATTVGSSSNPSLVGQSVTFTATVKRTSNNTPATGGTVTFKEGAAVLAGPLSISGTGQASFTTSTLAAGTHNISAIYSGTATYATSTGSISQVVAKIPTTTVVVSSKNPSNSGQSVTFTATVKSNGRAVTTGKVMFKDGSTNLPGPVAVNGNGTATITVSNLSTGNHQITAIYGPTDTYESSTGTVTQTVKK